MKVENTSQGQAHALPKNASYQCQELCIPSPFVVTVRFVRARVSYVKISFFCFPLIFQRHFSAMHRSDAPARILCGPPIRNNGRPHRRTRPVTQHCLVMITYEVSGDITSFSLHTARLAVWPSSLGCHSSMSSNYSGPHRFLLLLLVCC